MTDWTPVFDTAHLIAAGDAPAPEVLQHINRTAAHIIAVDGGSAALAAADVKPDCIMGDMDSDAGRISAPKVVLPDQYKSDLEKAIDYLLHRGVKYFTLYGAHGGARTDHAIANLDLLTRYAPHCRIKMAMGDAVVEGLCPENTAPNGIRISTGQNDMIATLPIGGPAVLTLRGAEYALEHAELQPGTAGVGNTAIADHIHIQIFRGAVRLVRMPEQNDA